MLPARGIGIAVLLLSTCAVAGVATADEAERGGDRAITFDQEYSQVDERGVVEINASYVVGEAFTEFRTRTSGRVTVVSTDGLSVERTDGAEWLVWDGETVRPTATLRLEVDRTPDRFTGYTAYDAGDWALIDPPKFSTHYRWRDASVDARFERTLSVAGEGVAGTDMVYLGPAEQYTRTVDGETIRLVDTAAGDVSDPRSKLDALAFAAERLDVGAGRGEAAGTYGREVTAFLVGDPLYTGRATGTDFFVHEGAPDEAWIHEYVHTQQDYCTADATAWTREAVAEYYGTVLTWEHDHDGDYGRASRELATGREDRSRLARPSTWSRLSDYEKGELVVAALDAEIRRETDGGRTFRDVFRALNERDGRVHNGTVREASSAAAGTDLSPYFEAYVYGSDAPALDDSLFVPADGRGLSVEATAVADGELSVTVRNTGPRVAAAPELAVRNASGTVRVDGAERSAATLPDVGPGESVSVPVELSAPSDAGRVEETVAVELTNARGDGASAAVAVAYGESAATSTPTPAAPTPTVNGSADASATDSPTPAGTPATSEDRDEFAFGLGLFGGALLFGVGAIGGALSALGIPSVPTRRALAVVAAAGVLMVASTAV